MDWKNLLAKHDRWLRTVVYARLRDASAVDEVMQEVALAAVSASAPPQDPAKAAPWLYRVAVRQALLLRRKLGRQRKHHARFRETAPVADNADPLNWLLTDERRQLVRSALDRLPPREAEILLLKYGESWRYRQIAERLGISNSAVEARLHRARKRLRAALASLNLVEVS